jgi:hypothetical protein
MVYHDMFIAALNTCARSVQNPDCKSKQQFAIQIQDLPTLCCVIDYYQLERTLQPVAVVEFISAITKLPTTSQASI